MDSKNISTEQPLLLKYMTILFLLVSFLSILGLFLLSRIYWKDAPVAEIQKNIISWKQVEKINSPSNFATMYTKYMGTPSQCCTNQLPQ